MKATTDKRNLAAMAGIDAPDAMTTEIPKRPTKEQQPIISYTDIGGLAWTPLAYYDHEHSVARVAIEALRLHSHAKALSSVCAMCEALAKIEASGWKP